MSGSCRKAQSPLSCIHPHARVVGLARSRCCPPGQSGLLRYPARGFKRRPRHSDSSSRRFQLEQVRCPPRLAQRQLKRKPTTSDLESAVRKTAVGAAPASFLRGQRGRRRPTRLYGQRVPLSSSASERTRRLKNGVFKRCYRPTCRPF